MALIRNGSNLQTGLNRMFSALGSYGLRGQFDSSGAHRSFQSGEHSIADVTNKSGAPNGYRHPASWLQPQKGGAICSRNEIVLTVNGAGVGALGMNMVASSSITLDVTAVGGLIAGGVATCTISISATAAVTATIGSTCSATISISAAATPSAIGWLVGASTLTISGAGTPYGIGWMTATTAEAGLSVTGIVNSLMAAAVENGMTLQQALRLIAAATAGEVSGAGTSTVSIRSAVADDADRIVATVDGDGNRSAITYDLG